MSIPWSADQPRNPCRVIADNVPAVAELAPITPAETLLFS